MSKRRKGFP